MKGGNTCHIAGKIKRKMPYKKKEKKRKMELSMEHHTASAEYTFSGYT